MHSLVIEQMLCSRSPFTVVAFICTIASFSDNFSNQNPSAEIQILNINRFKKQSYGNDEVSLILDITADLQSLFTWNTKQVFTFVAAQYETPMNSLNQANPDYKGVCHVAFAQEGHCRPGEILLGTDSHTCIAGAFGQFATGIETLMQALC